MHMYLHKKGSMCVPVCVCVHVCMCVHDIACVFILVCMYVSMHYMYIRTHIHTCLIKTQTPPTYVTFSGPFENRGERSTLPLPSLREHLQGLVGSFTHSSPGPLPPGTMNPP